MKGWIAAGIIIVIAGCAAGAAPTAQQSAEGASIVGAWTLNKEASDPPPAQSGGEHGHRGGGGSGGGHGRGGGYGRGGGRGMGGGGGANRDPEEIQRRMQAMRDLLTAPDHMTITRTESLIIITAADGRTTRLSPDGKKIKDESTGIERKTTWQSGTLVSEISGSASGKIIESYAVDTERGQLTITLRFDSSHQQQENKVVRHVYDRDKTGG